MPATLERYSSPYPPYDPVDPNGWAIFSTLADIRVAKSFPDSRE